jgi:hypothetical protein
MMKKKSKLEKVTPLLVGACMLTFLGACGSSDDDNSGSSQQEEIPQEQQEGTYRAVLTPVNTSVAGEASGTADFEISSDEFKAMVEMQNAPNSEHLQHVFVGSSCPTEASDANGDGFVDVVEATASTGGILIPLDNDLSAQDAGGTFPSGASFNYQQSTSLLAMLGDLRLPDTNPEDAIVKLGATEELNLEGKVVVIHGVPNSVELPETVLGLGDIDARRTLPIACGVIQRVPAEGEDTETPTGEEDPQAPTGEEDPQAPTGEEGDVQI